MFKLRADPALRLAILGDLFLFMIGTMLFSVLPIFGDISENPVEAVEIGLFLLGVPGLVLLFGRLFERPFIYGNEWGYLYCGIYITIVAGVYFLLASNLAEWTVNTILLVMFASGMAGGYGSHIIDGGRKPLGPRLARRFAAHD